MEHFFFPILGKDQKKKGLQQEKNTFFPPRVSAPLVALTFGSSTAVCEASFSTLSRVLTPYKCSMTHTKKQNLVLLAFFNSYTKNADFDVMLRKFAQRSRKIQLF